MLPCRAGKSWLWEPLYVQGKLALGDLLFQTIPLMPHSGHERAVAYIKMWAFTHTSEKTPQAEPLGGRHSVIIRADPEWSELPNILSLWFPTSKTQPCRPGTSERSQNEQRWWGLQARWYCKFMRDIPLCSWHLTTTDKMRKLKVRVLLKEINISKNQNAVSWMTRWGREAPGRGNRQQWGTSALWWVRECHMRRCPPTRDCVALPHTRTRDVKYMTNYFWFWDSYEVSYPKMRRYLVPWPSDRFSNIPKLWQHGYPSWRWKTWF